MTFVGESWAVFEAVNYAGSAVTDSGALRSRHTGTVTLQPGDSIMVGIEHWLDYLGPDDQVVFSWVVTAASGSALLRVAEDMDPDYLWPPPPNPAGTPLGDHTVTAAAPLVLTSGVVTYAELAGYSAAPVLQLTCLSGEVELLQVRMRAWPPGGPRGALRPVPAYSYLSGTIDAVIYGHSTQVTADATTDPNDAAGPAKTFLLGDTTAKSATYTPAVNPGGAVWQVGGAQDQVVDYTPTLEFSRITFYVNVGHVRARVDNPVTTVSEAWAVPHPDEVPFDQTTWVRNADGSPVLQAFDGWTSDVVLTPGEWPPGAPNPSDPGSARGIYETTHVGVTDAAFPEPDSIATGGAGIQYQYDSVPAPPGGDAAISLPAGGAPVTVPLSALAGGPSFQVLGTPPGWNEAITAVPTSPELPNRAIGFGGGAAVFPSIRFTVTVPLHYAWDPDGVSEIPMRIRQRGDGLGMGAPRVRGTASRQRSTRVRGHY